jgi:hypothetical protein
MANNESGCTLGPGFIVFIVFLVLKLTNTIAWSWWWVTCPLWIGFAVLLGVWLIAGTGAGLLAAGLVLTRCSRRYKQRKSIDKFNRASRDRFKQ